MNVKISIFRHVNILGIKMRTFASNFIGNGQFVTEIEINPFS